MKSDIFQKHIGEDVEKFDVGVGLGLVAEPGQTVEDLIKTEDPLPLTFKFQILFYTKTGVKDFALDYSKMALLGKYIARSLEETMEDYQELADDWLHSPNNPLRELLKQHGYIQETP